ncbi:MAG: hypothetical protein QOK19_884 [Solirubrobacteraceae bacterium]|jgi:hypothetical protein|nr:hypothetical protein [Solirubrobacterales bacterium]MEA2215323.1 hypothetical protein [Solirubrobacteraceae bacterium]
MRLWPKPVYTWGSTEAEREQPFPCDELLPDATWTLFRAVDAAAPAGAVFRWLCQLRVAPYSYDRLDNWGRRSPQALTPGLERLEVGQRVMTIFRLAAFEPGESITVVSRGRVFGEVAVTYRVRDVAPGRSRLIAKVLVVPSRRAPWSLPMRLLLAPGDLVMMRRQLLNLAELASRGQAPGVVGG